MVFIQSSLVLGESFEGVSDFSNIWTIDNVYNFFELRRFWVEVCVLGLARVYLGNFGAQLLVQCIYEVRILKVEILNILEV